MSALTVAEQIEHLEKNYLPTDIVVMHLWEGGDVVTQADRLGYSKDWKGGDTIWVLNQLEDNLDSEIGISYGICDEYIRQRAFEQEYFVDHEHEEED